MEKLSAKKSLGQHFLRNPHIASKIVAAGKVSSKDRVLEIGPGTGMLTRALLATGATVIAIEADERALPVLEETFTHEIEEGRLTVIHADIRTFDVSTIGEDRSFKVVANIPYYISGYLFRTLLSGNIQPSTLVFLVQKEVAERIARSKKESLLSLSVKAYGDPHYVATVTKGNFSPPPKVDSAILAVSDISRKRFNKVDEEFFFELLHAGFAHKRKQLKGELKKKVPEETVTRALHELLIPLTARGEDLDINMWCALAEKISAMSTKRKSA